MSIEGYSMFKVIGVEGKRINIIPRTETDKYFKNLTEIYNKKGEYLGMILFDTRKRWNKFALVELDNKMQMTKDCLDEAFKMCENYWENEHVK